MLLMRRHMSIDHEALLTPMAQLMGPHWTGDLQAQHVLGKYPAMRKGTLRAAVLAPTLLLNWVPRSEVRSWAAAASMAAGPEASTVVPPP
jgi:hypothetical protein